MTNRWAMLALLVAVRITFAFQFGAVSAISPYLMEALHIDYASLGTLISIYMLPGIAVALPGGIATGRFGERSVGLAGLVIMILGAIMSGLAEDYSIALAGRVVSGIGAVLLNLTLTKMVMDWFAGREVATAMALYLSSWPLGIALALFSLASLAAATSVGMVFFATAAFAGVGLVLLFLGYREGPGAVRPAAPAGSASGSSARRTLRLTRREVMLVSLVSVAFSFCSATYIAMVGFVPTFLVETGVSAIAAAQITSIGSWTYAVGVPLGGILADRTGRAGLLVGAACVVTAVAVASLALVPGPAVLIGLIGLIGFASAFPQGILKAVPVEVLRAEVRGPGLGLHLTWHYIGLSILPPAAGAVADLTGTSLAAVLCAGGLILVSGVLYWLTRIGLARPSEAVASAA